MSTDEEPLISPVDESRFRTLSQSLRDFRVTHPTKEGWALLTRLEQRRGDAVIFNARRLEPNQRVVVARFVGSSCPSEKKGVFGLEPCEEVSFARVLMFAWFKTAILECFEDLRQVGDHPCWWPGRRASPSAVPILGFNVDELSADCAAELLRIAAMTQRQRERLCRWLQCGDGLRVVGWWARRLVSS